MFKQSKVILAMAAAVGLFSCSTERTAHFKNNRFQKRALVKIEKAAIINEVEVAEAVEKTTEVVTANIENETVSVNNTTEQVTTEEQTAKAEAIEKAKAAVIEYNSKTRREKREIRKDLRQKIKSGEIKINPTTAENGQTDKVLLIILAIFIPPLAVYLYKGIGNEFWIDLLLTLFFWLPGVIYAFYVLLSH